MMVKICGITVREDAEAAVLAGAAAIGFNFYTKSSRYITEESANSIAKMLPSSVLRVGVFVNESPAQVKEVARTVMLDVAQLHGELHGQPSDYGPHVWRALSVDKDFRFTDLSIGEAEAYVLDAPAGSQYGGTGSAWDWSRFQTARKDLPVTSGSAPRLILAGGLDAGNVAGAIRIVRPWGVDACSRLESSPGKKDHHKMAAFIRAALDAVTTAADE
jgi:phosphoribosylanthranilate isomerase